MKLFTIITVCYNAENDIKRTIESVLNQSFTDYEYLIVDGLSKDKTVLVAKSYETIFKKKGVQYRIRSEKDTGIYSAMNKGTDMADGKWLLFLNAGDTLANEQVLKNIAEYNCDSAAILYGDVIYSLCDQFKKIPAKPLDELKNGMVFCHQSAFIRRDKMKEYQYDETFRIAADYDMISRCYTKHEKFVYVPVTVSIFELGGCSSNPLGHMLEELQVRRKNGFITEEQYMKGKRHCEKYRFYYKLRSLLMKHIDTKIINELKKRKYQKLGFKGKELVV